MSIFDLLWNLRSDPNNGPRKAVFVALKAAERALPTFEAKYPEDSRPRRAVELAKRWMDANPDDPPVSRLDVREAAFAAYAAYSEVEYADSEAANAACAAFRVGQATFWEGGAGAYHYSIHNIVCDCIAACSSASYILGSAEVERQIADLSSL